MDKNYKYIFLTIITLCVFTITVIELTGVSKNAMFRKFHGGGEGEFYSKDGEIYRGEIYSEQTRTRTQQVAEMPKTTMQFYETKYTFGTIQQGKVVSHQFRFKNTGSSPLMIAKTDVSCGCTVPTIPNEPIPPGSDGEITISFNSEGHPGFQTKNIIVHSNAIPEAVSISIEADVN